MKKIKIGAVLPFIIFFFGNGFIRPTEKIEFYDKSTGFFFRAVYDYDESAYGKSSKKGEIINLFIFDPKTNQGHYVFGPGGSIYIRGLFLETGYNNSQKSMEIYNYQNVIPYKNNQNIQEIEPLNKILIVTLEDPKDKKNPTYSLWTAEKNGKNLKKIMIFSEHSNWHVDIKNRAIRILDQKDGKVMINSLGL